MTTEFITDRHKSSSISKLILCTKEGELTWIQLSGLRDYLANDGISLQDIHLFQSYLHSVRSQHFSPILRHSYISFCESKNIVFVLSQDARTRAIHLSYIHIDNRSLSWHILPADQVSLNRLYNIIRLIDPHDSNEEYADLLYSINDVRV